MLPRCALLFCSRLAPLQGCCVRTLSLASFHRRRVATPCLTDTRRFSRDAEAHVIPSPFPPANIPGKGIWEYVWDRIDTWPDHTAIVCGLSGRGYTYRELRERCRRFGSALLRMGLEPGSVVGVVLPNTPDYPVVTLGTTEAGFIVTTVNPAYTPAEIAKQLVDADPSVLVCLPENYPDVVEAVRLAGAEGYKTPRVVVAQSAASNKVPEGTVGLEQLLGENTDVSNLNPSKVNPETVAIIPYSSGTTGLPKGVRLSHRNIIANCVQIHDTPALDLFKPTTKSEQDVVPAVLPFFHIYGLVGTLLGKLQLGVKVVTLPKFEAASFLNTLKDHKATVLYLVPPLILFLSMSPAVTPDHLAHCRFVVTGAAPIGEKDAERFLTRAPNVKFIQGYGLTESSPVIFFTEIGCKKLASVGKVVPSTTVKIVDLETGESLGPGKVGEVCAKGPQVMLSYHNNAKATGEMIDQSGWMHTGDLGYYDEDRDFFIVERLKELIKVKGFQVAPAELEELLRTHPEVADAAVIGIPDARAGELPLGFVVPKKTDTDKSAQLINDVKKYVADKLSAHKHLAEVRLVTSIPKNQAGKILRKELREMIKKEMSGK